MDSRKSLRVAYLIGSTEASLRFGFVNKTLLLTMSLVCGACSLYQSDGRKFLEKQALQYSRSASVNSQGCGSEMMGEDWLKTSETDNADVYSNDSIDFTLRVVPRMTQGSFHCTYQFASVQEMIERTESAIDLTLEQIALGLVP